AETPLPTVVPAYTSTPRPTASAPSGSFPAAAATIAPTRPPTSTPAPRGTFTGPGVPDSRLAPTATPVDSNEPNDTAAQAKALGGTPLEGWVNGPGDVDVFSVAVGQ